MKKPDFKEKLDNLANKAKKLRAKLPDQTVAEKKSYSGVDATIELIAGVGAGAFLGYYLDYWLDTKPFLFILLLILGFISSIYIIYKNTK